MIDTIVFDVGNVLVDFCWEKCFHAFGYEGETFEKLANATVRDNVWDLHDKGDYADDEILDMMIKNDPSMEKEIRNIYDHLYMMIEPRAYAKDWILNLQKAGYKVYILSNYSRRCFEQCKTQLDAVKLADGMIFSFQEKLIKPDSAIYKVLLERYGIDPSNSVFIDDREDNIMTARSLGMNGIVFKSKEQVEADLTALIGPVLN